eukprot:1626442-Rhodomonas_salina.1
MHGSMSNRTRGSASANGIIAAINDSADTINSSTTPSERSRPPLQRLASRPEVPASSQPRNKTHHDDTEKQKEREELCQRASSRRSTTARRAHASRA